MLPLWLALAGSVALHAVVLAGPGWGLPADDDPPDMPLAATLLVPAARKAAPPAPQPVRRKIPPANAPVAAMPDTAIALAPAAAEAPAGEPGPPSQEIAAAEPVVPAPAAVPPAPTLRYVGDWPENGRIVFQVTRGADGFIVGRSTHTWRHDGESYLLRIQTETVGLAALFRPATVVQESRGVLGAAGLQPLEFRTERDGKPKDGARFDLEQGRIVLGNGQSAGFSGVAQDLLSWFYQLGALRLDGPPVVLTVATGRKVAEYRIAVGAPTKLDTPLGEREVRHLKVGGGDGEDMTEVWLDTQSRLPLRIRHRDRKGEIFDQIATEIQLEKPQ